MLRELAHKQMSENTKCSAFEVVIKSLRVDRENVEKSQGSPLCLEHFRLIPLYLLPGSHPIVEAST